MAEARTGKRFPLELPIRVAGANGITRNVSAAGVYLTADKEFGVGSSVELDLVLPASVVGGTSDVHVLCQGHVVRVDAPKAVPASEEEQQKLGAGLACVIDYYKMVRAERSC